MDDLLAGFQGGLSVSSDPYDPCRPHPRLSQYKLKREGYADQEARRRKALEEQNTRRKDFADYARRIIEGELFSDDEMEEGAYDEVDGDSRMESSSISKRDSRQRSKTPYKNQLMLSEWLVEVPTDFQENWYLVVCPVAKRCLVLSANGSTTIYSRSGHYMKQFPSHLPGGSRKLSPGKKDYCILDCLFEETSSTFYVLDVMCWGGYPVYDSDTEFRFYWLNAKMTENGDNLVVQTRTNPYKFIPLQHYSCSFDTLVQIFSSSWSVPVDGLLFFHKKSHYFLGRSPLVLWLKPHMVTDILGLPVSQEFLDCVPVLSDVKMETDKKGGTPQKMREEMETEKDQVKQLLPTEDICT